MYKGGGKGPGSEKGDKTKALRKRRDAVVYETSVARNREDDDENLLIALAEADTPRGVRAARTLGVAPAGARRLASTDSFTVSMPPLRTHELSNTGAGRPMPSHRSMAHESPKTARTTIPPRGMPTGLTMGVSGSAPGVTATPFVPSLPLTRVIVEEKKSSSEAAAKKLMQEVTALAAIISGPTQLNTSQLETMLRVVLLNSDEQAVGKFVGDVVGEVADSMTAETANMAILQLTSNQSKAHPQFQKYFQEQCGSYLYEAGQSDGMLPTIIAELQGFHWVSVDFGASNVQDIQSGIPLPSARFTVGSHLDGKAETVGGAGIRSSDDGKRTEAVSPSVAGNSEDSDGSYSSDVGTRTPTYSSSDEYVASRTRVGKDKVMNRRAQLLLRQQSESAWTRELSSPGGPTPSSKRAPLAPVVSGRGRLPGNTPPFSAGGSERLPLGRSRAPAPVMVPPPTSSSAEVRVRSVAHPLPFEDKVNELELQRAYDAVLLRIAGLPSEAKSVDRVSRTISLADLREEGSSDFESFKAQLRSDAGILHLAEIVSTLRDFGADFLLDSHMLLHIPVDPSQQWTASLSECLGAMKIDPATITAKNFTALPYCSFNGYNEVPKEQCWLGSSRDKSFDKDKHFSHDIIKQPWFAHGTRTRLLRDALRPAAFYEAYAEACHDDPRIQRRVALKLNAYRENNLRIVKNLYDNEKNPFFKMLIQAEPSDDEPYRADFLKIYNALQAEGETLRVTLNAATINAARRAIDPALAPLPLRDEATAEISEAKIVGRMASDNSLSRAVASAVHRDSGPFGVGEPGSPPVRRLQQRARHAHVIPPLPVSMSGSAPPASSHRSTPRLETSVSREREWSADRDRRRESRDMRPDRSRRADRSEQVATLQDMDAQLQSILAASTRHVALHGPARPLVGPGSLVLPAGMTDASESEVGHGGSLRPGTPMDGGRTSSSMLSRLGALSGLLPPRSRSNDIGGRRGSIADAHSAGLLHRSALPDVSENESVSSELLSRPGTAVAGRGSPASMFSPSLATRLAALPRGGSEEPSQDDASVASENDTGATLNC